MSRIFNKLDTGNLTKYNKISPRFGCKNVSIKIDNAAANEEQRRQSVFRTTAQKGLGASLLPL